MTSTGLPYVVLITARSDYLPHFQRAFASQLDDYSLKPMPFERIRDVIEGPARVAGLSVEPALIAAAEHDAPTEDVLPLLAFTLRILYDRFASSGRLTLEAYRALGDATLQLSPLENAVRRRADEVLQEARPNHLELQALKDAFVPSMVSINDNGEYVGRPARLDGLPASARPLIDCLVEGRLLVISGDNGAALVEVAHEALLRNWPLLHGWLDEEKEFIIGKRRLEDDLAQWSGASSNDKPAATLAGLKLTKARSWLSTRAHQLSEAERAFIQASIDQFDLQIADKLRFKRRLRVAGVLVACLLAIFAVYAAMQWRRADNALETAITTANQIVSDLGHDLRDRVGMPVGLVRTILQRAQNLQQALLDLGETRPELQISAGRALNELVLVLLEQGDFRSGADVAAASIIADRFLSIMERLSPQRPNDAALRYLYSLSLHRAGDVQMAMGRYQEALRLFGKAGDIRQALLGADGDNETWQAAVAANYLKIGDARNALGSSENKMVAYTAYDQSLAIRKDLAIRSPVSSERKRDLALSYERQGNLVRSFGQWQEALGLFREALDILMELAASDPQSVRAQRELAVAKDSVGAVQLALLATEDALQLFRESFEIRQNLAVENPSSQSQRDLAVSFGLLGDALAQKRELPEAISLYQRGLVIHERLSRNDPHNAVWRTAIIKTLLKLAEAGDSPRERLSSCLQIARNRDTQDRLAPAERELIQICEERLEGLPR